MASPRRGLGLASHLGSLCVLALALLARPASAQTRIQAQPRPQEMFRQYAPGLLARTTYADSSGAYRVELWDLLVGPGNRSGAATLPGAAVFEVRGGSGRVLLDGRSSEFRQGATFAVGQGVSFVLENGRSDLGLSIRAVVITARAR